MLDLIYDENLITQTQYIWIRFGAASSKIRLQFRPLHSRFANAFAAKLSQPVLVSNKLHSHHNFKSSPFDFNAGDCFLSRFGSIEKKHFHGA